MKNILYPVILAGGVGTRLWPVSTKSYPKQFSYLINNISLFQKSLLRFKFDKDYQIERFTILTNEDYRFIVEQQMSELNNIPRTIIIEPEIRNTAPAVLAACYKLIEKNLNPIIIVCPSDHLIPDEELFHKMIFKGINAVKKKKIITFGIKPDRPETGYGYIKTESYTEDGPVKSLSFIEKPKLEDAEYFLKEGIYLWNSGIFMFSAEDLIEEFQRHAPSFIEPVKKSVDHGKADKNFFRLSSDHWLKCENTSLDYAIMEKSSILEVIPFNSSWTDLGDWNAVCREKKAYNNNYTSNNTSAISCKNVFLSSENKNQEIVGVGLENIITVATKDAVLILNKDYAQQIREVVPLLRSKGCTQAESRSKVYRPWGWYESLLVINNYQIKILNVHPKAKISLQSHKHREEHWVVVEGIATVELDNKTHTLNVSDSIHIPKGIKHRLENLTDSELVVVETQIGSYLGEDDIIRYEDAYSRV